MRKWYDKNVCNKYFNKKTLFLQISLGENIIYSKKEKEKRKKNLLLPI